MGKVRPGVTVKGTKDGLLFILEDDYPFSKILDELRQLLEYEHASLWDGPDTKVVIKLGQRRITAEDEVSLRQLFSTKPNLMIQAIVAEGGHHLLYPPKIHTLAGTVRSGQVLFYEGDLLLLGDVNPGGSVQASGNIYILGALRGIAHAGSQGDETALIAASIFRPTQLRIADIISRPPDEWDESDGSMRFAYLVNQQIAVDQIQSLNQLRPELEWKRKSQSFF